MERKSIAYRLEHLLRDQKDQGPYFRKAGYRSIGDLDDPIAVEILVGMLGSDDPSVRADAAWALGETGDVRAVETALESDKPMIVVVHLKSRHPLAKRIREEFRLIAVTEKNRDDLAEEIASEFVYLI